MLELIIQEIRNLFREHKLIFTLSVLAFTCACVGINASLTCSIQEAAESTAAENTYGEKAAFKITMDGDSDSFNRVFGNQNAGNVKALFEALQADDSFTFRYTKENLIDFFDPNDPEYNTEDFPAYKEEFRVGYETGTMIDYDDYLALKAFYADRLFCSEFGISIAEGRAFVPEDFVVSSPESIVLPVLMGNDYRELYEVGDKIENAHLGTIQTVTLEVIGFFSEGSYFYDNNTMKQILDRYMVIPAVETSYNGLQADGYYDDFTHASYDSFKIENTRILCEQSEYQNVKAKVMKLFREMGFSELYLFEESEGYEDYLQHAHEDTVASTMITVFIVLMIVIMICIQTYYRILQNQKKYCILMLNGITTGQIFVLIIAETFLMFVLSAILFFVMKYALKNCVWFDFGLSQYSLSVILTIEGILLAMIGCFGVWKIRRLHISTVLREHE